jgi:catechol 2,3-dioxygenase-like lactoylglutathione lyase family enzyme
VTAVQLEGIHHVSINVRDNDEAARFYVETLGLDTLERPDFGFPGTWLAFPDGRQVHLIEDPSFVPPAGPHFAVRVADIHAAVDELRAKGVEINDPYEIPRGGQQAFFTDPSGNQIELNQPSV